jgi:hypothetical protein
LSMSFFSRRRRNRVRVFISQSVPSRRGCTIATLVLVELHGAQREFHNAVGVVYAPPRPTEHQSAFATESKSIATSISSDKTVDDPRAPRLSMRARSESAAHLVNHLLQVVAMGSSHTPGFARFPARQNSRVPPFLVQSSVPVRPPSMMCGTQPASRRC